MTLSRILPPFVLAALVFAPFTAAQKAAAPGTDYADVKAIVQKYCLSCHSAKAKKGSLDLERFATTADLRKDAKVWEGVIEQMEAGEMPPKDKPQPTAEERKKLMEWTRAFLDAEAKSRVGDPGRVPLRRLSNAEYDYTIRDLTGVDLRPAREFPADGAAGEGFTNAAEALADVSPTLLNKYLNAAKGIADHAVLLPDGFRFSASKTRRDWTDEVVRDLKRAYAPFAANAGKLNFAPYIVATIRHRDALTRGAFAEVATKEKLNAKYLAAVWDALTAKEPSHPLDSVRMRWNVATEKDAPAVIAEIAQWQSALWKTVRVGNYFQPVGAGYAEALSRQIPVDPPSSESVQLRVPARPTGGARDVTLYLTASETGAAGKKVQWSAPRFEAAGKPPLLLRDYATFGGAFELDYATAFGDTASYLKAAVELVNDKALTLARVAEAHKLDATRLGNWVNALALEPRAKDAGTTAAVPLTLLEEKTPRNPEQPYINGWRKKGTDLPSLVTNASDAAKAIPGTVPARGVAVHPLPQEFVAVVWRSPVSGSVEIAAHIKHAHPACGNGVAWWLEHRRAGRATALGAGAIDLGKEAKPPARAVKVEKGDEIVLAVDARDANHACDLTAIAFALTSDEKPARKWDLAADIANDVQAGNPHADKHGNAEAWRFVRGASKGAAPKSPFPPDSVLGLWRAAAADAKRADELPKFAERVQAVLSGPRPAAASDAAVYDALVAADSPLFAGVDATKFAARLKGAAYGLNTERFTESGSLVTDTNFVLAVKLPAALLAARDFVVDAKFEGANGERVVRVRAGTTPDMPWHPTALAGAGAKKLTAGHDAFRSVFPLFLCFPAVVPVDEVVSLKMFHREDEPLARLFLSQDEGAHLNKLWEQLRFVSRQPVAENDYLPQFIGFVTQDQPKAMVTYFEGQRPVFQKRADAFLKDETAAVPKQLDALVAFASRAYRRPLTAKETADLRALYQTVRDKGASHDEAFRGVLSRVLVSPAFLFRIEAAPPGKEPAAVSDWELASRLSYFFWASSPDDELRALAAAGKLRDDTVLEAQAKRMIADQRSRALAVEFGTQMIHVRGFDEFNEKNEKLFPTFDAKLKAALYEEAILFFHDLFRADRPVTAMLDADHTFLNADLAKHYGVPGVSGPEWRRVDGVRKFGRGGILGFGSVQAKQAGASRTSPVLRGNWVVETLLGEKLPKPPPNVPQLPEMEGADKLSMRQLVERHAKDANCASCHVRIDPFGFALERYDPIGRLRDKDLGGLALDTNVKLRDGTAFDGIDGLRTYLLTKKKDVLVRLFCKRLLGYALGRSVTLSDTALLDEMVRALNANDGKVSAAVRAVVLSAQFRKVRGADFGE